MKIKYINLATFTLFSFFLSVLVATENFQNHFILIFSFQFIFLAKFSHFLKRVWRCTRHGIICTRQNLNQGVEIAFGVVE
jgi:hypothetical protein